MKKQERFPIVEELYRSLQKEVNKLNLNNFTKLIESEGFIGNKIVDLEASYTWDLIEESNHPDNSDTLKNLIK